MLTRNYRTIATVLVPPLCGAAANLNFHVGVVALFLWCTFWPLWLSCELEIRHD